MILSDNKQSQLKTTTTVQFGPELQPIENQNNHQPPLNAIKLTTNIAHMIIQAHQIRVEFQYMPTETTKHNKISTNRICFA